VDVVSSVPADQKIRIVEGNTDYHVVRPVQWTHVFPESVAVGDTFIGQANIRPELFEKNATVIQVKLTGLGDGREVLLSAEGGAFVLGDEALVITGEAGIRALNFVIEQQTSLGVYKTALPVMLTVTPALLPVAAIAEQQIDFGQVEVERSGQVELKLYNNGQGSLTILSATGDVSEITVLIANTMIPAGDSTQVFVTFRPQAGGSVSGVIDFMTNDPDREVIRLPYVGSAVVIPADPRADFDGNGDVGFGDFLAFAQAFGSAQTDFDLDGSGGVDFGDFLIFVQSFGKSIN